MVTAEHLIKEFQRTQGEGRKAKKTVFRAVNDVSLRAADGETLGILGPNGAGKTTLLRMLGALMEPSAGKVAHYSPDGRRLTRPEEVKARMGYLSNNTRLYEKFTPRELMLLLGQLYGMPAQRARQRAEEVIGELHMEGFADNRVQKLSTGQVQRASIARCLFPDPDLYILDEPTLGLDIMSAAGIVDFMRGERAKGKTIVYSTHYLEEAQSLCDRVILLNRGGIVGEGSPAELCRQTGEASLREAFLKIIRENGGEEAAP